ncbi:TolC family protein [Chitinophaga sp. GCM10012297]|uniref:TolC family protein n=1 Tax=Chitinophaga chungangae TaxID=2821488 RepID=A0ABS3YBV2_9BACT|nr:TolC family protein [Chitinophaga chungangae]MBO9152162.1 TolC family protein [Chitinophaga chungangae]
MKRINNRNIIKSGICLVCMAGFITGAQAQPVSDTALTLSLRDVIGKAKESNKLVAVMKTEESATRLDLEEARAGALPRINASGSYQRYTRVTLYDGVWGDPHSITKPPNANAGGLALETSFNLYAGGRQRYIVTDSRHKNELASINIEEQKANTGLQAALHYLELIRYYYQGRLISDQVTRARTRSQNIAALYANGKITKSDVLRADVLLSNVLLNETANKNDYRISNRRLNILLGIGEFTVIIPADTASLSVADSLENDLHTGGFPGNYAILKAGKNIELQENRTRLAQSFNKPAIALFGGYGFNYPNTFMFPPVAQTLSVGTAGVKVTYEISSLYQHKNNLRSSRMRETALAQQKDWITENVRLEAKALEIKYYEAVHRVHVTKKSIEQAETNYHIQNTKYFNQLSLLTDLLDADNLYQESRFNYLQANIAAMSIYYRLLFITGKL